MYIWLKFGRNILLKVLIEDDETKLEMPVIDNIRSFQESLCTKYPVISDAWAISDDLKLVN